MKRSSGFVLAIDGPAGSGKSTTARLCAERLGFRHLDTGAMYRAVTLRVIRTGTDIITGSDECRMQNAECKMQNGGKQVALLRLLRRTRVSVTWDGRGMRTFLDGKDVSEEIRSPAVSSFVSEVSAIPAVRRQMVAEQRRVATGQAVVCEGRDIGSVVFPNADLKIYLECDAAERTRRRRLELVEKGTRISSRTVLANLVKRDRIDSGREVSPLRRMPDSVLVDTSHMTIEEQVAVVCDLARRRIQARGPRGQGFQDSSGGPEEEKRKT